MVNAELFKISNFSSWILPLFPYQTTKSPDDPGSQRFENIPCFGQAVIVPPSSRVHIQIFDNLTQAFTAVALRQSPDSLLEPFYGFGMNPDFRPEIRGHNT